MAICRFFKMAAAAILDFWNFKFSTVGTVKRIELHYLAKFRWNRPKTRPRYVSFNIMLVWLENAYSRPFLRGFWGTFPLNDVTHRPNHKRTILGLNHVIWAMNRQNRSHGSSWAREREKKDKTGQEKVTKGLYFTYLWRSPHWSLSLIHIWRCRRSYACRSRWSPYH